MKVIDRFYGIPKELQPKWAPLTREEEKKLAKRWQKRGDKKARDRLAISVDLYVFMLAKGFANGNPSLAHDFLQEGRMGAMRATDKFDPDKGKFVTYAKWWILAYIGRYVEASKRTIPFDIVSLDVTVFEDGAETRLDSLVDDKSHPEHKLGIDTDAQLVRGILPLLNRTHGKVVWWRFFDPNEPTLAEIGQQMGGISREAVRQHEATALAKIKRMINFSSPREEVVDLVE